MRFLSSFIRSSLVPHIHCDTSNRSLVLKHAPSSVFPVFSFGTFIPLCAFVETHATVFLSSLQRYGVGIAYEIVSKLSCSRPRFLSTLLMHISPSRVHQSTTDQSASSSSSQSAATSCRSCQPNARERLVLADRFCTHSLVQFNVYVFINQ